MKPFPWLRKNGHAAVSGAMAKLPKVRDELLKAVADLTKEKDENTRRITVLQETNKQISDRVDDANKMINALSELC